MEAFGWLDALPDAGQRADTLVVLADAALRRRTPATAEQALDRLLALLKQMEVASVTDRRLPVWQAAAIRLSARMRGGLPVFFRDPLLETARKAGSPAVVTDLARALADPDLMGEAALPPTHPVLRDGRLVDRWGSPWLVHPLSSDVIQLRSAGPDRRLFTADDLVAPPDPET